MLRPGQFTLRALLVAVAFVAAACAVVQFSRTTDKPLGLFWVALAMPVTVCGAIGAFRGRAMRWIEFALAVEGALMLLGIVVVLLSLILSLPIRL